mgnify:CR=1 FL=1
MLLKDKVALITGGAGLNGLGYATAARVARPDSQVALLLGDDGRAEVEEAGLRVPPERFARLGGKVFPTPGMAPECFHLLHAEVSPAAGEPPPGDGSPMEEGCILRFVALSYALRMCDRGEIEDAKTELALRRLHAYLATGTTVPP